MPEPRCACVIGWPAAHSRSPLIHNHWLAVHGLVGEYRREAVPPDDLAAFVRDLGARGYLGANVTLPHKEAVLGLARPDSRALAVGAANTIWRDGDALRSTNTDVEGFLHNLDEAAPGWDADLGDAVVLGAGGAARAIVFALISRGVRRIHVVNRTAARAEALRAFGDQVHVAGWINLPNLLARAQLLVNTTTLGMHGQSPLAIDLTTLPDGAVVSDAVYIPLETPLLAAAKARGLRTADGLGMLLHQAVRGFSLWFGVTPRVTPELRAIVVADLARS